MVEKLSPSFEDMKTFRETSMLSFLVVVAKHILVVEGWRRRSHGHLIHPLARPKNSVSGDDFFVILILL